MNLGSITIDAPTSGYVWLSVSAYANIDGDGSICGLGIGSSSGDVDLAYTHCGFTQGTGGLTRVHSLATQVVVPVTSGSHTFYATAYKTVFSADQTMIIGRIHLTGLFVGA